MAKVDNSDYTKKHGKMNRKDNVIHRVRNGKEHVYSILADTPPASDAQKARRAFFGKVNSLVNIIMADPEQKAGWTARMEAHNHEVNPYQDATRKRYLTTRQYVFAVISAQLAQYSKPKRTRTPQSAVLPKGTTLQIKPFADLSAADLYEIIKARFNVFYLEQEIRYPDLDNVDYTATHISLRRNGLVVAYARLFSDAQSGLFHVGRMLTINRKQGLGRFLMNRIIEEARRQGAVTLCLNAQAQAVPFYSRLGFHPVGSLFSEADIPHLRMEMTL